MRSLSIAVTGSGAILAALLFAASAPAQDGNTDGNSAQVEALLTKAREAKAKRDFETAARLYAEAMVLQPKSAEARSGQADTRNDDYWYGRKPVAFEVPTGGQWQSAHARDVGTIQRAPDFRRQIGGPMTTAGQGTGAFGSYKGAAQGSAGSASAVQGGGVGPISGPINAGNSAGGGGPVGPVFAGGPSSPSSSGGYGSYSNSRDNSPFGGGNGRRAGEAGIAAAILGVILYGVYDYAIPVDLSIDPMPYLRGGGFSPLFGFSRMEAARPVGERVWKTSLVYGNWFTSADDEGADASVVPANGVVYRFDENRFDEGMIRVDYGIGWGISAWSGFTVTNMQETSEKIIFNRNGYVHVAEQDRGINAGNLLIGAKWGYPLGGDSDPVSGIGAGLDLKVPIGDPEDFATSGTFDVSLVARWTQLLVDGRNPWILHVNAGLMVPIGEDGFFEHGPVAASSPAPPPDDEIDARPAMFYGVGVAWRATQHIALTSSFEANASPFDGQGDADGLGDGGIGIVDGLSFTANLGIRVLFDKLEFEASIAHDLGIGDIRALTGRLGVTLYFGGPPAPSTGPGAGAFGVQR